MIAVLYLVILISEAPITKRSPEYINNNNPAAVSIATAERMTSIICITIVESVICLAR
ncbi:MAG: hypothetical protein JWO43_552 [Candidatus Adlerbacteria bacterium]|nr:hypothetical protein [Candidatus Adlerbacteria bacterium]